MPSSVLFCCDHNSVRSPMAEGLMKKYFGTRTYVQSAGVRSEMEVDGFAVSVCAEIGVPLHSHRARSFKDLKELGDDISSYDLIIALSPAAHHQAMDLTRVFHIDVEYWPIMDPTGLGTTRDDKLTAYRETRDQLIERIQVRFGPLNPEKPV